MSTSIVSQANARSAAIRGHSATAPIGVLDSGLGGLSVVKSLRLRLPFESILYFADSAYCPYGERDESFIRDRTLAIARQLQDRGAKALVIACNTACTVALDQVRASVTIPVVGLEPAVKPAVARTRTGRIAVFATPRTVASDRLARLIDRYAAGIEVERIAAPEWVDLVEQDGIRSEGALAKITSLVRPAVDRGADVLVLGCTHFPFLTSQIQHAAGSHVAIVDSGDAIARRTRDILDALELLELPRKDSAPIELLTSSARPSDLRFRAATMLGAVVHLA
ncbi:MAG: glutamate racemase [Thermomicrobiales bacterium]